MLLNAQLQRNVDFRYYESGHMIYLNPAELTHMGDDLRAWYASAVGNAEAGRPRARPGASGNAPIP
jgi:carboxypeptidase C (cathepsin A)